MESFSLLKYWRGGGGGIGTSVALSTAAANVRATTIAANVRPSPEPDDDEGPFFDLEFAAAAADEDSEEVEIDGGDVSAAGSDGDERDFRFPDGHRSLLLSPSDDLFFKGRLAGAASAAAEQESKTHPAASSLLKSATKLSVLMLASRKPKSPKQQHQHQQQQSNKFLLRFKVEEVPIVSLFSSKAAGARSVKEDPAPEKISSSNSKDVVQRYLNKIRPLYLRASKRSGEREEARKQLGKSRSASAAVAAAPAAAPATPPPPRRRDDSLLLQQDGIQSAIAHCKRSFHADRVGRAETALVRSKSDRGGERAEDGSGERCI